MQEHQKQVSLALDEMKVSEGLVYSHSNGDIIGFTSLGTIGDKMAAFTRKCVNKTKGTTGSNICVSFNGMARAICASYRVPIA